MVTITRTPCGKANAMDLTALYYYALRTIPQFAAALGRLAGLLQWSLGTLRPRPPLLA
jgi:hypothetical protein